MRGSKSVKERNNLLKKCASVFCVSEFIRKQFVDGLSNKLEKVHVLYNGIQRSIAKLPRKEKDILFVGRLTKDKGVHIYVDIAKKISKQYPNWTFSLIGSSETRDLKNPNSFSSQNIEKFKSIGNQAYYYGFQNQDFVHAKMLKSSIILIPSFHEAFSLVAAEAMSNGIAIIASNVGGMAEIINKNGILINDINKLSFEKALLKLLDDDIVRKKFQNEAWKNFHYFADKSSRNLDKHRKLIYNRFFNFSSNLDTEK
jgi:glycosyltransferase involved in cell wall biosynthesis